MIAKSYVSMIDFRRSGGDLALLGAAEDDAPPDTVPDGDKHVAPGRHAGRKQFMLSSYGRIESQLGGSGETKAS